jgi:hypothetical protein
LDWRIGIFEIEDEDEDEDVKTPGRDARFYVRQDA